MEIEFKALNFLKKTNTFFETYHVTTLQCYRNTKAGGVQEVRVEILDAGPDYSGGRYQVHATTKDGKAASGNSMADIEAALAVVHWGDLDK
jgi:hypothetical protein